MWDLFGNLGLGFGTVLRVVEVAIPGLGSLPLPLNIMLCFLGCLVGLGAMAAAIGENDEAERIALFLAQLDPSGGAH